MGEDGEELFVVFFVVYVFSGSWSWMLVMGMDSVSLMLDIKILSDKYCCSYFMCGDMNRDLWCCLIYCVVGDVGIVKK